jgi:hypothetical protein
MDMKEWRTTRLHDCTLIEEKDRSERNNNNEYNNEIGDIKGKYQLVTRNFPGFRNPKALSNFFQQGFRIASLTGLSY